MIKYTVDITANARLDVLQIFDYIAENDSPERADRVTDELNQLFEKLESFPERGGRPMELLRMDIHGFREKLLGPYRIFYRIDAEHGVVTVVAVADGRRDMLAFLTERLG